MHQRQRRPSVLRWVNVGPCTARLGRSTIAMAPAMRRNIAATTAGGALRWPAHAPVGRLECGMAASASVWVPRWPKTARG